MKIYAIELNCLVLGECPNCESTPVHTVDLYLDKITAEAELERLRKEDETVIYTLQVWEVNK